MIAARNPDAPHDSPRSGRTWPQLRAAMTDGHFIIDRMAEEALAIFRDRGNEAEVNEADFWRAGWDRVQVETYGGKAIELARQMLRKRHLPPALAPEIRAPA